MTPTDKHSLDLLHAEMRIVDARIEDVQGFHAQHRKLLSESKHRLAMLLAIKRDLLAKAGELAKLPD